MMELHDRVVLLTGAAGGIGSALARAFAAEGARLALVDRDEAGLSALAGSLPSTAQKSVHPFDLRAFASFETLLADVLAAHGGIDVLVNNAGLTVHGTFEDHTEADLDRVLDINLARTRSPDPDRLAPPAPVKWGAHRARFEHGRRSRVSVPERVQHQQVRVARLRGGAADRTRTRWHRRDDRNAGHDRDAVSRQRGQPRRRDFDAIVGTHAALRHATRERREGLCFGASVATEAPCEQVGTVTWWASLAGSSRP